MSTTTTRKVVGTVEVVVEATILKGVEIAVKMEVRFQFSLVSVSV